MTRPVEPVLAALLAENGALQEVDGAFCAADGKAAASRAAALRDHATHAQTRAACEVLLEALAGLDAIAADAGALAAELRRAESAASLPTTSRRERDVLLTRQHLVRRRLLASSDDGPGIPRVIHLVRSDDRTDDLPLLQFLCYRSVLAKCQGYRILLHTPAVPRGPRWQALLPGLELQLSMPPRWLGTHPLIAAAHQSDVWRVKQLIEHGGFYFDWDMLLLRAPEELRANACVMALERQEPGYHEVMGVSAIGAQAGSVFLRTWLEAMPSVYNPRRYVSHSTVLARELALRLPALLRVLDHRSFYDPGWSEEAMRWLFDPALRLPEEALRERLAASIGIHLFCSHANFLHWARGMTETDIEAGRGNLAALMRPYL